MKCLLTLENEMSSYFEGFCKDRLHHLVRAGHVFVGLEDQRYYYHVIGVLVTQNSATGDEDIARPMTSVVVEGALADYDWHTFAGDSRVTDLAYVSVRL